MILGLDIKEFDGNYNTLPKNKLIIAWACDYGSDEWGWKLITYHPIDKRYVTSESYYYLKEIKYWGVMPKDSEIRKYKISKILKKEKR